MQSYVHTVVPLPLPEVPITTLVMTVIKNQANTFLPEEDIRMIAI